MDHVLDILIAFGFLAMAYQDFRYRAFSWVLVPVLLILLIVNSIWIQGVDLVLKPILTNIATLGFIMIGTFAYMSLKKRKWVNIIDTHIGLGDMLLFVLLCVFFSPLNFIVFFVGSLTLITLAWGCYLFILRDWSRTIPLAGAVAVLVIMLIGAKWCFNLNYYDDQLSLATIQPILWR